jgi:hypothetical protein
MKTARLLAAAAAILLVAVLGCGEAQVQTPSYHLGTTVTTVPPTWVDVVTLSGTEHNVGDPFTLFGQKVRLVYTVTRYSADVYPVLNVYVMEEGKYLNRDGGVAEVRNASGSGETTTIMAPGVYYLDVSGANCTWEVTVYEWQ